MIGTSVGRAPVAVALDTADLDTARRWAEGVGPHVRVVKVGLELYLRHGADAVRAVRAASGGLPVFLDVKLHDIPNTVAGAARALAPLRPAYVTAHASGGAAMIRAAVAELPDTKVAAVTVLTSLSAADLATLGIADAPLDVARRLAALAVGAGARALVCSPREVAALRTEVGPDVELVTPGVRPAGAAGDDQSRVATPGAARAAGADLLVIGRPITAAADPAAAAAAIAAEIAAG